MFWRVGVACVDVAERLWIIYFYIARWLGRFGILSSSLLVFPRFFRESGGSFVRLA